MKKLLIYPIVIFLCFKSYGQSIDDIVLRKTISVADSVTKSQLLPVKTNLDTIVYVSVTTTPSVPQKDVDTLKCGNNETQAFFIHVIGQSSTDGGGCYKEVIIKNTNGIYKILYDRNVLAWSGTGNLTPTKASVNASLINNIITIKVNAVNNTVTWKYKREKLQ